MSVTTSVCTHMCAGWRKKGREKENAYISYIKVLMLQEGVGVQ